MQQLLSLPFGLPCLRRQEDVFPSDFVDLSQCTDESSVGKPLDIIRLIVGEPGVGKTRTLLEHPFAAKAFADGILDIALHPDTHAILDVQGSLSAGRGNTVEYWQMYWRIATLRCIATHLLYSPHWNSTITPSVEAPLTELVKRFMNTEVPVSVTDSLTHICRHHLTRNEFKEFYGSENLQFATVAIDKALEQQRPLNILLDVSDEVLDNAPTAWSECLQGMMCFVLDSKKEKTFRRVNIAATLPARVYRAAMEQPRARNAYALRADVLRLIWRIEDAREFLHQKIGQLPSEYIVNEDREDSMTAASWLGLQSVNNHQRGIRERIENYILRHTRLTPRHIIALGNSLSVHSRKAKERGVKRIDSGTLKHAVHKSVQDFAQEMFIQCACEIVLQGYARDYQRSGMDVYEGANEDVAGNSRLLESTFSRLTGEDFTSESLYKLIQDEFSVSDEGARRILRLLWNKRFFGILTNLPGKGRFRTEFAEELFEQNSPMRGDTRLWLHTLVSDHIPVNVSQGIVPAP